MIITGRVGLPSLFHTFDIGSDHMAKEYATKQSVLMVTDKYYHFAVFHQEEDQQELLTEWRVKLVPTIVQGA
jgi:hypothetical protein